MPLRPAPANAAGQLAGLRPSRPATRAPALKAAPRDGYLAFLGRISPEKRPDRAIEISALGGRKLRIAAKVDAVDRVYRRDRIEPLVRRHANVELVGKIGEAEKPGFLGNALLFPIDWPEPFGLATIEAMACATPVIGWRSGSVPEVIDHGRTGFIVGSVDEAVAAVGRLPALDRHHPGCFREAVHRPAHGGQPPRGLSPLARGA